MTTRIIRHLPIAPYRKDRCVRLQHFEETGTDTRGQTVGLWRDVAIIWASINPVTTRTAEAAHMLYSEATHRIFIDYRADVNVQARLVYGARVFHIGHAADIDEAHVTMELLCTEGAL